MKLILAETLLLGALAMDAVQGATNGLRTTERDLETDANPYGCVNSTNINDGATEMMMQGISIESLETYRGTENGFLGRNTKPFLVLNSQDPSCSDIIGAEGWSREIDNVYYNASELISQYYHWADPFWDHISSVTSMRDAFEEALLYNLTEVTTSLGGNVKYTSIVQSTIAAFSPELSKTCFTVSKDFLKAVNHLPKDFDQEKYMEFALEWGVAAPAKIVFGWNQITFFNEAGDSLYFPNGNQDCQVPLTISIRSWSSYLYLQNLSTKQRHKLQTFDDNVQNLVVL